MEDMFAKLTAVGSSLDTDEALRLQSRPDVRGGKTFLDFGSTQWNPNATLKSSPISRKREVRSSHSEVDSDDEIDCLSGSNVSHYDTDAVSTRKNPSVKRPTTRLARSSQVSTPSPSNKSQKLTAVTNRPKSKKKKTTEPGSVEKGSSHVTQQTSKPRPKPRPVTRNLPSFQSPFGSSDDDCIELQSADHSALATRQTYDPNLPVSAKVRSFPDLSPLRDDNRADTTPKTKKPRSKTTRAKTNLNKRIVDFPTLSPLSCPKSVEPSNDRVLPSEDTDAEWDDEEDELGMRPDDNILTRGGLRPFPMEPSMLKSIPVAEPTCKRNKKPSRKSPRSLQKFPMTEEMFRDVRSTPSPEQRLPWKTSPNGSEDDELASPVADPRTLCPYCDTRLPSSPTPTLLALISRASKHKASYLDPRPGNPRGRRAPVQVFIGVCQRHRFESEILPEAERRGWPKTIEWGKVRKRVKQMEARLRALFDDSECAAKDKRSGSQSQGPRIKCVFWQEVIKEVKTKGSRVVSGVRGQYSTFQKVQPGYYGELGSVIIHQTLYDLFPPDKINPSLTAPLTPDDFIRLVLVPEVGLRLIMEDKGLTSDSAITEGVEILRASAKYGVAMFPEDEGEWGDTTGSHKGSADEGEEMSAADVILMERARRRRMELAREEAEEEEEILVSKAARKQNKGRRGLAGGEARKQKQDAAKELVNVSNFGEANPPKPIPRPRPVGRGGPPIVLLPAPRYNRSPSRGQATQISPPRNRAVLRHSKSQGTIRSQESSQPSIDVNSSDGAETTDDSYCGPSPSKRRKAKAKGKQRDITKSDSGTDMEMVIPHPTRVEVDMDATPRGATKKSGAVVVRSSDDESIPGPSNKNFRPLKAARARKRNQTTTDGERRLNDWKFKMSAPICTSDDDSLSRSSGTGNIYDSKENGNENLAWLLGDSD